MRIKIYQIDSEKDTNRLEFQSLKFTQKNGGLDPSCYKTVFYGDVTADNLEDIYHIFNTDIPGTHQGHSLSVSDIVEVLGDVPELAGRIDFLGSNGSVGETIEYTDLAEYKREIAESNNCGRPIRATLLTDRHLPCAAHGCYFCEFSGFEKVDFDSSRCADMAGTRVLFITPRHSPLEIRIGNDLKSMQRAVGGMIEFRYPFSFALNKPMTAPPSALPSSVFLIALISPRIRSFSIVFPSSTDKFTSTVSCPAYSKFTG